MTMSPSLSPHKRKARGMLAEDDTLLLQDTSEQQQVYFPFVITISLNIRVVNVLIQLHLPPNIMILNEILKVLKLMILNNE